MKEENHPCLQNIQCFLHWVGKHLDKFGPHGKRLCKKSCNLRLQNILKQNYDEYHTSPDNTKQCRVLNSCYNKDYVYSKKKYLSTIEIFKHKKYSH